MTAAGPSRVVSLLLWLGLLALPAVAQQGGDEPVNDARVELRFDPRPGAASPAATPPNPEGYYSAPGGSTPARPTGDPATPSGDRFFNSPEQILGPPPTRTELGVQRHRATGESARTGPDLGLADGQPLHPGQQLSTPAKATEVVARAPGMVGASIETPAVPTPAGRSFGILWVSMGLFASLAANVFFGWVAWDIHTKYQHLVEEMDEDDVPPRDRRAAGPDDAPGSDRTSIASAH